METLPAADCFLEDLLLLLLLLLGDPRRLEEAMVEMLQGDTAEACREDSPPFPSIYILEYITQYPCNKVMICFRFC